MKRGLLVLSCILLAITASCVFGLGQEEDPGSGSDVRMIRAGGIERSYLIHVPRGLKRSESVPLVLVFHGGRGTSKRAERATGFSRLADKERFIVVYPQGIGNQWNDGRDFRARRGAKTPELELAFVSSIIDRISEEHRIDQNRVFATGMSNGGFFSHLLGARMSDRIAAIAPVIGGISVELAKDFKPLRPVSVLIIQGTEDPLVPYGGGSVLRNRGRFIGTEAAAQLWRKAIGAEPAPQVRTPAERIKRDGCTVETYLWKRGNEGTEVLLYKLVGAGHTWPGGSQYLPRWLIGGVCREIDATELIWRFFKSHPRRAV